MVFRVPPTLGRASQPRSLRDVLLSASDDAGGIALSDKFDIARQLATSISYVRTFGLVHKNIRPETIVAYRGSDQPEPSSLASFSPPPPPAVFLIGFDNFRREEGKTYRIGDDDWRKNLYRHPTRQGPAPDNDYVTQHDIYNLGVCLLEIGLWKSFLSYDDDDAAADEVGDRNAIPSAALGLSAQQQIAAVQAGAGEGKENPLPRLRLRPHWYGDHSLKDHLVFVARTKLPRCVGPRYAAAVETCLACLDPNNTDFGDEREFMDRDGVLVGVRYIEKVLSQLNAICV